MNKRQPMRSSKAYCIRFLTALLCAVLAEGAMTPLSCNAEEIGAMKDISSAISEYLVCYPLELMRFKDQQLTVTPKALCLGMVYHVKDPNPFWVTPDGPCPNAQIILDFLKKAEAEGLDPKNYEVDKIAALFTIREPRMLAELDTLLTFNLIKYIHDVSKGQIKPYYAEPGLFAPANEVDFEPVATMAKVLGTPDLAGYLEGLPPAHPHYTNLKTALMTYRAIEKNGGWPSIPEGKIIRPGDDDDRMPAVIRRLFATGDLAPEVASDNHYSPLLKQSIIRFQARHGLAADGNIGPNTLAAMNVSAADRIQQIIVNMTRWRWQAHDLGEKYILVNIANFDLRAFDAGQEIFQLPVIVGKYQHQTPIFSDRVRYISFNPYWNVPPNIAANEELPKLKTNSHSLVNRHIRLFSGWSDNAGEIDSRFVDWKNVSPAMMRQYKLRQDSGPWNALGMIKFDFPNQYDVYLHDTPTQNLFSRTQRDFSHGCIRVSDPLKLAAFVLQGQAEDWPPEKISSRIKEKKQVVLRLAEPVPVHITYQTSWVDKSGIICFNNDIYDRDRSLRRAIFNQ
jgi:L,D-transpeptidase YcbB